MCMKAANAPAEHSAGAEPMKSISIPDLHADATLMAYADSGSKHTLGTSFTKSIEFKRTVHLAFSTASVVFCV